MHKIFLLSVFILLTFTSAHAEVTPNFYVPIPKELTNWVEAHTGIHLGDNQKFGVIDNEAPLLAVQVAESINGVTDAAYSGGNIYFSIRAAVHWQEDKYEALLIHELVHKAQDQSGRKYSCSGKREAEAYTLQNQFLIERGLPAAQDPALIIMLDNCMAGMRADVSINKY
jgi:hypothetical protein